VIKYVLGTDIQSNPIPQILIHFRILTRALLDHISIIKLILINKVFHFPQKKNNNNKIKEILLTFLTINFMKQFPDNIFITFIFQIE
jgi:hypothetical protein